MRVKTIDYQVQPGGELAGELTIPGDKSISHRALMFGGIAQGVTDISGFLDGEDCLATLAALQQLGVRIERETGSQQVRVYGAGLHGLRAPRAPLDMGNAGTAMRLFMGLLASQSFDTTLVGDASLSKRPMERVAVPLRAMGARITTRSNCPPVDIQGGQRLRAIHYDLPVASAQVKSALLLAGLAVDGATTLTEPAATRDHTERMLRAFGATLTQKDRILKLAGQQTLQATPIAVPGDFSSAAFFLVAGCLAANPQGLLLKNVGLNPTRTGLLELLRLMGARIEVYPKESLENNQGEPRGDIRVYRSELSGIEVPPQLVPLAIDELPVFFVAAACAKGETRVTGAGELRVKESDRLAVMAAGLTALGVSVALQPDGLQLQGCEVLRGGRVASHGDHRAAMSFAVAALRAREAIVIDDVANVATSFPGFVAAANRVGLAVATL